MAIGDVLLSNITHYDIYCFIGDTLPLSPTQAA